MLAIRTACAADKGAIARLMATVFGESEEGIALFFSQIFSGERCIVAQEQGEVCGMFHILPASFIFGEERLSMAYLYALAVAPERRGKGIAGEVMRYLSWYLPRQGYQGAVLRPASPDLFDFYRKFGYRDTIFARYYDFTLEKLPAVEAAVTPAELSALPGGRDGFFKEARPLFSWDESMLRYAGSHLALYGGKVVWIEGEGFEGYAVYYEKDRKLAVQELGGSDAPKLLSALCRHENTSGGSAVLPVYAQQGRETPHAAVLWFSQQRTTAGGYLSLALE